MEIISPVICLTLIFLRGAIGTDRVNVFTVATDNTHGLQRFLRSAKVYDINVKVLGLGEEWRGGNMASEGGGHKINILKKEVNNLMRSGNKDDDEIILFTDGYDVMFLGKLEDILERFLSFKDTRVLFSAESFCWPDIKLASKYPTTSVNNPYLNSGGFIGYLSDIAAILNYGTIGDKEDDQLYFTKIYIDNVMRVKHKISLDHNSVIFQNLNGALIDVNLKITDIDWPYIQNIMTKESPLIIHGNGPAKLTLNYLGNYLAKAWSVNTGCNVCKEKRIDLNEEELPVIKMAVFIEQATPFLEEFLQRIANINYPKNRIHLLLRNNVEYHETEVDEFFQENHKEYITAKRIKPDDFITEAEARNIAKDRCINMYCDYLFVVDSVARIEPHTLRNLISSGFDVIAPLLVRPGQAWSNFWGALNQAGFYARSPDYMNIVYNTIRGIWNVPFISNCYLIRMSVLNTKDTKLVTYAKPDTDSDMVFCESLREVGIFMYVSNEVDYGHLVNAESYDISRTHPDMYQVIENKMEWESRYLNKEYHSNFEPDRKHMQPCPDVYWFPIVSKRFCVEWVEVMEAFGQWSDGSNNDKRLESGYEAVPTRDIHMTQVGLEKQWLHILKEYVRPLQELVFTGYFHNPPVSTMNFVVRYRPDEQPSLRPHHDSSTYTINIALNNPHVDFEGGGCRFIRYNCSVVNTRMGWMLMHPGRLTHYHEGLKVTRGTRYIMISFVDP